MKVFQTACALLFTLAAARADEELDAELQEFGGEARLFFVNFTSSLIQVNATILAYGLIFLAIVGAAAVALYYLFLESQKGGDETYGSYGQSSGYNYQYARSNDAYDFNGLNIVSWISMLQELYEKFDYRDLDCQKRLICEVMKEPEYYGTLARKFKNGFQYAKYLEFLNLPDDMRELLDEYMDANSRSQNQKECKEFFECPFSVKDTMSRALPENHL